jgi:hypothetical protein
MMTAAAKVQRTLIVGLGAAGAKTADLLLADLERQMGRLDVVAGLAVLAGEVELGRLETPLLISPAAGFEGWQAEFESRVRLALQQISRLDHLADLARQGLKLDYPAEVQLWLIVDLAEPPFRVALDAIAATLRQAVYQTLACQASLSGLLLNLPETSTDKPQHEVCDWPAGQLPLPLDQFDRGCFLAGLTNEVGLIIGELDDLIRHSVYFLSLLLRNIPVTGLDWAAGWNRTLTHFGVAHIRWPGPALLPILSLRWTQAILADLIAVAPVTDLAGQARQAAQQWLTADRLAPVLLIDRLAAGRSPLPQHLVELVPDPPWPWLLVETRADMETVAQQWQADWSADREQFEAILAELESIWPARADAWLRQQLAAVPAGAVVRVQAHLAAVSELLRAFVEGIEQKLAEAESEQAQVDQHYARAADALAKTIAGFPASPLRALLGWGWQPLRWLEYGLMCRQAQSQARQLAHLLRAQLQVWQKVWFFEELLPFYQRLLAAWQEIVAGWNEACQQVIQARQLVEEADWAGQLERLLAANAGPWTASLAAGLYHEAVETQTGQVRAQSGALSDWQAAALAAEQIVAQLEEVTGQALQAALTMSVDRALRRQFPADDALSDWLAGLAEQARPFWRYDETALAESSRSQVRLERWLLLAEGENSPLVLPVQSWNRPPVILTSPDPGELAVVTVRQVQCLSGNDQYSYPEGGYDDPW